MLLASGIDTTYVKSSEANGDIDSWKSIVPFEDMMEIDRILWSSRDGDEIEEYLGEEVKDSTDNIIRMFYNNSTHWYLFDGEWELENEYIDEANGVLLDLSKEKDNPRDPYATWFHLFAQWTDNNAVDRANGISTHRDSKEYISTGTYADEFYNAIIKDCEAIRNVYRGSSNEAMLQIIDKQII